MIEIQNFLFNLFSNDATLQTLVGGSGSDKHVYPVDVNALETFPCMTFEIGTSFENTTPQKTQETNVMIKSYSNISRQQAEDINSRIKLLMRYKSADTSIRLYWSVKADEFDMNENDRLLFVKVLRYTMWTKITT